MQRVFALLLCIALAFGAPGLAEAKGTRAAEAIVLEAGYNHSFALDPNGVLWAWGANEYGRLGTGASFGLAYDAEEVELEGVVEAAAGWYHSLLRTEDGGVYAMGCNYDYGQVGDGSGQNRSLPVRVMDGAVQIAAGRDFSVALKADGTVWTWGRNDMGQLGLGHTDTQTLPAQVELENVAEIAAGESFVLARLKDGSIYAWGDNAYGQIDGAEDAFVSTPRLLEARRGAVAICAGVNHAMALLAGGTVSLWGDDYYGQLAGGDEALGDFMREGGLTATRIEAGGDMSAMMDKTGAWYLWGDLFGDTPVRLEYDDVVDLSLGYAHALIARRDGTLWGRGANDAYQLGNIYEDTYLHWCELPLVLDGQTRSPRAPAERDKARPVEPFAAEISPVAAGYYTSFAIADNGDVWAWGRSDYGQLGAGDVDSLDVPQKLELSNVRQVAAGDYHTLFVTESGLLYGAGCSYDYDQLATGKFENENRPVRIMGGIERAWAGRDISAALDEEGAIWVWGANDVGQLGLGHTEAVDGPTQLPLEDVVDLAVGKQFMAALLSDGTVWTWGDNTYGQLGVGEGICSASPVKVALENVVSIAAGGAHMLALDADGRVWAWGAGYYGQIGNGGDSDRFTPVEVEAAEGCVAVFAGGDTSGARTLGGDMLLWGAFFYTEPYVEDILYYGGQTPDWIGLAHVSMGSFHVLGVDENGNVFATGENSFGQLGASDGSYNYSWIDVGLNLQQAEYVQPGDDVRSAPDPGNQAL
ncbi:MAG TPA: hypothetical protein IAA75_05075 [Candidatus Pullichristensenella avicola]|nr:hypothetical protein [Candidatus Pullichristensenella avicola]